MVVLCLFVSKALVWLKYDLYQSKLFRDLVLV